MAKLTRCSLRLASPPNCPKMLITSKQLMAKLTRRSFRGASDEGGASRDRLRAERGSGTTSGETWVLARAGSTRRETVAVAGGRGLTLKAAFGAGAGVGVSE